MVDKVEVTTDILDVYAKSLALFFCIQNVFVGQISLRQ